MIPIKYTNDAWQITSKDDNNWYNYSDGKLAAVMLSDGYYISEERADMSNHELAKVGNAIPDDKLGTIYIWIPRCIYTDNELIYLKDASILETPDSTLANSFSYEVDGKPNFEIKGVWVEKGTRNSISAVNTLVEQMNAEDNIWGLIANELVETLSSDLNKVINKLQNGKQEHAQQVEDVRKYI